MANPARVDYCQYLLSTPVNYTLTHFADLSETFSHDQINRYLASEGEKPYQRIDALHWSVSEETG